MSIVEAEIQQERIARGLLPLGSFPFPSVLDEKRVPSQATPWNERPSRVVPLFGFMCRLQVKGSMVGARS